MVIAALVFDVVFLVLAFGVRTLLQRRRTGDAGWRIARARSFPESIAHGCLVSGALLLAAAPVVALVRGVQRDAGPVSLAGLGCSLGALVLVVVAQLHMGESWRIGQDPDERTALVTGGVYRWVRNPIYSGIALFAVGQLLMVPNLLSGLALGVVLLGIEVQVRAVEEPHLRRVHEAAFAHWEACTGRFLPGLGRSSKSLVPYGENGPEFGAFTGRGQRPIQRG
jgi:protein-S-isoprenylcysteine O-methyltransferase Ste14